MRRSEPPAAIKAELSYAPATGVFTWTIARAGVRFGQRAGYVQQNGYRIIRLGGVAYMASHLAWWFGHGEWPTFVVDHENLERSDDRLANLRKATHSLNHANQAARKNNTSGYKGVCRTNWRGRERWMASIRPNRKFLYLGHFDSAEGAARAYDAAAVTHFGAFARLNFPA